MLISGIENDTLNQGKWNLMTTMQYSRFLGKIKIRGGRSWCWHWEYTCQNVWNAWNWWSLTYNFRMNCIWRYTFCNFDYSIIDDIILTNLIFLGSKLEVPKLNTKWYFFIQTSNKWLKTNMISGILTEEKFVKINNNC